MPFIVMSGDKYGSFDGNSFDANPVIRSVSWVQGRQGLDGATHWPTKEMAERVVSQVHGTDGPPTIVEVPSRRPGVHKRGGKRGR